MTTPALAFAPMSTTTFNGGFEVQSDGLVQGVVMDDPAVRYALAGGILAAAETLPMWPGVGIYLDLPAIGGDARAAGILGPTVGRATTLTQTSAAGLLGFSCANQFTAGLTTPQNPVPVAANGMTVPYFPLGSGARIAVQCDPSLAAALAGGSFGQQVSWDTNDQILQPYVASGATESITSITWASTNGGQGAVVFGSASVFGVGDTLYISGATNTGTGGATAVNGPFVVTAFTDTTHMVIAMPAAAGVIGTIAGTIVANVGIGALACKILKIQNGNSKVVAYNPTTGAVTWNPSGCAALIQI